jgi:hypothetical protein
MITIAPGQRVNGFEVLSIDPIGKRVCVGCPCGGAHLFGVEALLDGSAMCNVMPLTREQRERRYEAMRQQETLEETRREQKHRRPCWPPAIADLLQP